MRDVNPQLEAAFFDLFKAYFDLEKDAGAQHDSHNYTLARMEPLAALAGHPEQRLRVIHVAGTKGKGSTCYYMGALLNAAGKRCGLFTSPHVDSVRERFQLDGRPMDYAPLTAAAADFCARLKAAELKPSLFEIFTVLALKMFADAGVDYAILETGIGGRVDATNYVPDKVLQAITPVSFDHMALLGTTIEAIAGEKAGIITTAAPVVVAPQPYPAAEAVLLARAVQMGAPVVRPDATMPTAPWLPEGTPDFLQENFRCAYAGVASLGETPHPEAFHAPLLRARFQLLRGEPPVLIDAAHNGDSARRLAHAVLQRFPNRHFVCVLGVLAGKDIAGIVEGLKPLDAEYILVNPRTPRASAREALLAECRRQGLHVRAVLDDIACADDLPADTPLIFTGSFFTALTGKMLFDTEAPHP